ncbi:DUF3800 domain-containing protein [Brevundimonas sp. C43]|uniref:DUF3800 domain-containing protein n=1 Tax=Brevundimonas sp. C43 TaxID=3068314 RepID=UPI00273D5A9E|nr:DUF3800 domain-containing protein [Brevundimonas sp. C43]
MNASVSSDAEQLPLFAGVQNADGESAAEKPRFSDYIVYVDESGDHSMVAIDDAYPVFVLSLCVFHKAYYGRAVVPSLEAFKFAEFGHDIVILHERDIRKETGQFRLSGAAGKNRFMGALSRIIQASKFVLISCVIDKRRMVETGEIASNPYHVALKFCLEQLRDFLSEKGQLDGMTHVVVEGRGKKEDAELELEFRRVCDGANRFSTPLPFSVVFADKKANSSGLQLADLVARPIGLSVVRLGQANRAFDILKKKFFCRGGRATAGKDYEGVGYLIYPEA